MASVRKVLGQVLPAANVAVDLDVVPAATSVVVSTIMACNQSATATTFSVAVRPGGAGLAALHYVYYFMVLAGNDTFAATLGLTLAATDVITVRSTSGTVSFSAFGEETS